MREVSHIGLTGDVIQMGQGLWCIRIVKQGRPGEEEDESEKKLENEIENRKGGRHIGLTGDMIGMRQCLWYIRIVKKRESRGRR